MFDRIFYANIRSAKLRKQTISRVARACERHNTRHMFGIEIFLRFTDAIYYSVKEEEVTPLYTSPRLIAIQRLYMTRQ